MFFRGLPSELQMKAISELNEDTIRLPEDIRHIKKWLETQKYLNARTDNQTILAFLRGRKFSLEKTKRKIENYYTMRGLLNDVFCKRNPFSATIQEILSLGIVLPLPKLVCPDAPRIVYCRYSGWDPSKQTYAQIAKVIYMIFDVMINEDDNAIISGVEVLHDLSNLGLRHLQGLNFGMVKKELTYVQEALPIRVKSIHIINPPQYFDIVYNTLKPLIKEKMIRRVKIYNKDNSCEGVPKEVLPNQIVGDVNSAQALTDYWKCKVESYAQWFENDEKYRADESKRPNKPKTISDLFGIEGSFRDLTVD